MMPTGEMHLVLRLAGPPVSVFEHPGDAVPRELGHAVVNGARAGMYAKDVTAGSSSVGLQLRPGASLALLGLPPRLYLRVQRFQQALRLMQARAPQRASLAALAFDAGYSDQPHFNRDFRAFSGLTPEQYRAARPATANHVPVSARVGGDVRFVQDRRTQAA